MLKIAKICCLTTAKFKYPWWGCQST